MPAHSLCQIESLGVIEHTEKNCLWICVEMSAHSLHVHQHFMPLKWSVGHGVYHMCGEKYLCL